MMRALCYIYRCFSCPVAVFATIFFISAFSLSMAIISEIFLGLEPCKLCIYQRWPFGIAILLSIFGITLRNVRVIPALMAALGALAFAANSAIAFYHTGVEQKWWISQVEGCTVPNFSEEDQSWIDNLMSAPAGRCDEIPWQDPILGLSMANYNIALCFGLFIFCSLAAFRLARRKDHKSSNSVSQ